ncbi:hypothetical protein AMS68_007533 [Peltaster fructicola]|uniref:JmjC domain-containing protein n=1 Tax=Peltaster fructicola TaxID=286661 RepID=A0A6H0Y4X6_9PEZI|nr:hypothetical protein AMS68_007533 [Peltaster fructicola]
MAIPQEIPLYNSKVGAADVYLVEQWDKHTGSALERRNAIFRDFIALGMKGRWEYHKRAEDFPFNEHEKTILECRTWSERSQAEWMTGSSLRVMFSSSSSNVQLNEQQLEWCTRWGGDAEEVVCYDMEALPERVFCLTAYDDPSDVEEARQEHDQSLWVSGFYWVAGDELKIVWVDEFGQTVREKLCNKEDLETDGEAFNEYKPFESRWWTEATPVGKRLATAAPVQRVPTLANAAVDTFREAYNAQSPVLLPHQALSSLPAIKRWFTSARGSQEINASYLSKFGATMVPLEFSDGRTFARVQHPLAFFLECLASATSRHVETPNRYFSSYVPGARAMRRVKQSNTFFNKTAPAAGTTQIYLAQAPISELPWPLRADLPVPELVTKAGKGDIYDSSIWVGQAPTYTPLHKDPNPNLFVQLAGSKVVRLFRPDVGRGIFAEVQEMVGGNSSAAIRGEEMMMGAERAALDQRVWSDNDTCAFVYEAELHSGDALFIPKGWWHSIKSTGSGINGSVNWWFR